MTEPTFSTPTDVVSPPEMATAHPPTTSPEMADRLRALQASRGAAPTAATNPAVTTAASPAGSATPASRGAKRSSGPAPSRILAAATSVAAGIGLVALMAGAQQDIVVQVNPTPVTVQPASVIVEMQPTSGDQSVPEVQVRVVEPAAPAERPVPQARVVSQSEGS